MNRYQFLIGSSMIAIAMSLTASIGITGERLTEKSKVYLDGIGGVKVGMTLPQASRAAGMQLSGSNFSESCYYISPKQQLKGVSFMMTGDRVARVDINNKNVTTLRGAKIGDTEARIKSLYRGQIKVSQHEYEPKGHYLTFVPRDKADREYRVVFETDGKRVTRFRSGKLPEVEYVEGCS